MKKPWSLVPVTSLATNPQGIKPSPEVWRVNHAKHFVAQSAYGDNARKVRTPPQRPMAKEHEFPEPELNVIEFSAALHAAPAPALEPVAEQSKEATA
jgi:hypothetical protein